MNFRLNETICALFLILVSSCASTSFHPVVQNNEDVFGDYSNIDDKANDYSNADVKDIQVLSTLPKGITGANGVFTAAEDSEYQILGKVQTGTNGGIGGFSSFHATPLYFYPFNEDESWRKPYCWVQVPLVWLTLTLWAGVPTYYPCWTIDTNKRYDINNRKQRIGAALKKGAKAMGGDTILFLDSSGTKTMSTVGTNIGRTGAFAGNSTESEIEWTKGMALVLKKKAAK